jgi:hypothetical protein
MSQLIELPKGLAFEAVLETLHDIPNVQNIEQKGSVVTWNIQDHNYVMSKDQEGNALVTLKSDDMDGIEQLYGVFEMAV